MVSLREGNTVLRLPVMMLYSGTDSAMVQGKPGEKEGETGSNFGASIEGHFPPKSTVYYRPNQVGTTLHTSCTPRFSPTTNSESRR